MAISTILSLLFGLLTGFFAAVYCFKPDMIVRQVNEHARRMPRLLHFPLPIQPSEGRLTVRQVRNTGLGLFLISAWFFARRNHVYPWTLILQIAHLIDKADDPIAKQLPSGSHDTLQRLISISLDALARDGSPPELAFIPNSARLFRRTSSA